MPSSRPLFLYLSGTMDCICKIMFTCEPFKAKFTVTNMWLEYLQVRKMLNCKNPMTSVLKIITNTCNFHTSNDKTKTQKWMGGGDFYLVEST